MLDAGLNKRYLPLIDKTFETRSFSGVIKALKGKVSEKTGVITANGVLAALTGPV